MCILSQDILLNCALFTVFFVIHVKVFAETWKHCSAYHNYPVHTKQKVELVQLLHSVYISVHKHRFRSRNNLFAIEYWILNTNQNMNLNKNLKLSSNLVHNSPQSSMRKDGENCFYCLSVWPSKIIENHSKQKTYCF